LKIRLIWSIHVKSHANPRKIVANALKDKPETLKSSRTLYRLVKIIENHMKQIHFTFQKPLIPIFKSLLPQIIKEHCSLPKTKIHFWGFEICSAGIDFTKVS